MIRFYFYHYTGHWAMAWSSGFRHFGRPKTAIFCLSQCPCRSGMKRSIIIPAIIELSPVAAGSMLTGT
jgi:hypothetical protein